MYERMMAAQSVYDVDIHVNNIIIIIIIRNIN